MSFTARIAVVSLCVSLFACSGSDRPAGNIEGAQRPAADIDASEQTQSDAVAKLADKFGAERGIGDDKQILFGDLHVHSTYSSDAFFMSLPVVAGEGAHPPADACDFARYCASVDFFALTDHAEALTPEHWENEKESIRQCNERAGDPSDPDLVAFMGFEWTQVGQTRETHWGHKNVIFRDTGDDQLPARPINSTQEGAPNLFSGMAMTRPLRWVDPLGWGEYSDFLWLLDRLSEMPRCETGVDTRELPLDCYENAPTPEILFEKLNQWGFDSMVIPHGTTWGLYTPPGTSLDKHLNRKQHDPNLQGLIEIMSGHGNSEEYRSWREIDFDAEGELVCPEPTPDFLPCCWQAGEIMRQRCDGLSDEECEARVEEAKLLALEASVAPNLVFPDTRAEDWLDCNQCRDCFKPSLALRPKESVQYGLALSNFDENGEDGSPLRFRFGFIASSDNHTARPGTGYKQYERRKMTEATGPRSSFYDTLARRTLLGSVEGELNEPKSIDDYNMSLFITDVERVASFLYPGGLVATHASGRDRGAIWDAMQRREVYGTSGPRILLWFDLLNGPDGRMPMGSEVELTEPPRFEVRAVGGLRQQPGCPESSLQGLSDERLEFLCRGECYNPSDERVPITAIEIIRIRPQQTPGESVDLLIEDPWLKVLCPPDPNGCTLGFEDPDYLRSDRDVLYYARVLQEETPAVNGNNVRASFDQQGRAVSTEPCYGDFRTDFADDCLAPVQERAWSSPIFVNQAP